MVMTLFVALVDLIDLLDLLVKSWQITLGGRAAQPTGNTWAKLEIGQQVITTESIEIHPASGASG